MENKESIKRYVVKDVHGHILDQNGFAVVGGVHVTVVPGYGEPSADVEYVDGEMYMTLHNIEGNGITEIVTDSQEGDEAINTVTIKTEDNPEGVVLLVRNGSRGNGITQIVTDSQVGDEAVNTVTFKTDDNPEGVTMEVKNGSRGNGITSIVTAESQEDGGVNVVTFKTTDNPTGQTFQVKNGRRGAQGDSVLVGQGDLPLAHVLGQDNTKAMSQKGVTDEFSKQRGKLSALPSVRKNIFIGNGYVESDGRTVANTSAKCTDYISIEPIKAGDTIYWAGLVTDGKLAFYDDTFTLLTYRNPTLPSRTIVVEENANLIGATKVRASFGANETAELTINGIDVLEQYQCELDTSLSQHLPADAKAVGDALLATYDEVSASYSTESGWVSNQGELKTSSLSKRNYIQFEAGKYDKLRFSGAVFSIYSNWGYAFYDENDNCVKSYPIAVDAKVKGNYLSTADVTLDIPPSAVKFYSFGGYSSSGAPTYTFYYYLFKKIERNSDWATIPLPSFVQGGYRSGASASVEAGRKDEVQTYMCVTNSVVLLPYRNVTLKFVLPEDMLLLPKFYKDPTTANALSIFFNNGSIYEVEPIYHSFNVDIAYNNGSGAFDNSRTLDPDEVNELVSKGKIKILYKPLDGQVHDYIEAATHPWNGIRMRGNSNRLNYKYATFLHVSDLHGDIKRWDNALKAAEEIGVDAVINTGDNVLLSQTSGLGYIHEIGDKYDIPQLIVVGNHDTVKTGSSLSDITIYNNTQIYNSIIKNYEDDYSIPPSSDYVDSPTYYYKDFATTKLRFIALNLYEGGKTAYNSNSYNGCRISQKQIDWLCAVLANTPAGYGVMIGLHQAPDGVVKPSAKVNTAQDVFWQGLYREYNVGNQSAYIKSPSEWTLYNITNSPLVKIVDAFIGKTTCNFTYVNTISTGEDTITVNGDFTSLETGVEFVAWVFGHHHTDNVGYVENADNLQLCLCIAASCALSSTTDITALAETQDLPRGEGKGVEQDAFNVYCVDRDRGEVRIAKGGSNVTCELRERKYDVLPFKMT